MNSSDFSDEDDDEQREPRSFTARQDSFDESAAPDQNIEESLLLESSPLRRQSTSSEEDVDVPEAERSRVLRSHAPALAPAKYTSQRTASDAAGMLTSTLGRNTFGDAAVFDSHTGNSSRNYDSSAGNALKSQDADAIMKDLSLVEPSMLENGGEYEQETPEPVKETSSNGKAAPVRRRGRAVLGTASVASSSTAVGPGSSVNGARQTMTLREQEKVNNTVLQWCRHLLTSQSRS